MRIAIDTDTRQVRSLLWDAAAAWDSDHLARATFARRDRFPVEVRFVSSAQAGRPGAFMSRFGWLAFTDLPEGATGRLYLKPPGNFASSPLATAAGWIKTLEQGNATYTFFLNLDTLEMAAAFSEEPASLRFALEFEWAYLLGGSEVRLTSVPLPVSIANDYIRDEDGTPAAALDLKATQAEAEAGADNETWMTPLRTRQAIMACGIEIS